MYMKEIAKEMLKIYKPLSSLDWMNYKLVSREVTMHHIIKREHGGKLEVPNLAILMTTAHRYLHIIEFKDIQTYNAINKMFKYINQQRKEPTEEQRQIIEYLLQEFEEEHINDINSKGKRMIKTSFLRRNR